MQLKVTRGMLWTGDGQILKHGDIFEAAEPFASDYIQGKVAVSMEGDPTPPAPPVLQELMVPEPQASPEPLKEPEPDKEPEPVYTQVLEPEPDPEPQERRKPDKKLNLKKNR